MGVDYLFVPSVEQMYPKGFSTAVVVKGISERLEGRSRPGHFRGVATVVLKLLEIVYPGVAFFGRKDAQQLAVIRRMAADLALDAQIVGCPIVREPDGLALSSRNVYLDFAARRSAVVLYRALEALRDRIARGERAVASLEETMRSVIAAELLVSLDYAEVVNAETFEPAAGLHNPCYAVLAARVGGTRLIDNAFIEPLADGFQVTL
jgi:pantoate--beta-alanine ligase